MYFCYCVLDRTYFEFSMELQLVLGNVGFAVTGFCYRNVKAFEFRNVFQEKHFVNFYYTFLI